MTGLTGFRNRFLWGVPIVWNEEWTAQARCKQASPDELFVRGAEQHKAKQICAGCPVRAECLAEALDNGIEWGVWGGLTERERRAVLRKRPNVTSWRAVLEAAKEAHEEQKVVSQAG
jgi:WhiB family redox-sensing transcriptional regulator